MAGKIGKEGTPHTHIYVCFTWRILILSLKNIFQQHILKLHMGMSKRIIVRLHKENWQMENQLKQKQRCEGTS